VAPVAPKRSAAEPGVQLVKPTMPPERVTRKASAIATSGRGAKTSPKTDSTASKRPLEYGSASASATSQGISHSPSASQRSLPAVTSSGVRSQASGLAPDLAIASATLPLPAATSSARWPGPSPQAATSSAATPSKRRAATA
jgi:hypothetical protein